MKPLQSGCKGTNLTLILCRTGPDPSTLWSFGDPALNQITSGLLHLAQYPNAAHILLVRGETFLDQSPLAMAITDPFTSLNQPNLTQNHLLSGLCCLVQLLKPFEAICTHFRTSRFSHDSSLVLRMASSVGWSNTVIKT